MTYYNYHSIAKHLIKSGNCLSCSIFVDYHHIKPAMVFYFNNHKPIPVRDYRWNEYLPLIKEYKIPLLNNSNLNLSQFSRIN